MRLITWGYAKETRPAWRNAELREWRWALELSRWHVGIVRELKIENRTWRPIGGYYAVISSFPTWGADHVWYDGPNCRWGIGPFNFQRSGIGTCHECLRENLTP